MHRDTVRVFRALVAALLLVWFPRPSTSAPKEEILDIIIRGGRVIDGTGSPWFRADLGLKDGRIVAMGRLRGVASRHTLNAAGLMVTPGFIDLMGQTAVPFLQEPNAAWNLLTQGITTINAGEGDSAAPLGEEEGKVAGWTGFRGFFERIEHAGLPLNVVCTVGHSQVRRVVLGTGDRAPTPDELDEMKALVREGMEAGAIGVSTALTYPPAVYASEEEITALAAVAGEYGGRYFTHMRSEGDDILPALEEALRIGRSAVTPVHIFHLKAAGERNWSRMAAVLSRIRAARGSGLEVAADVYPYLRSGISLRAFLHPRHSAGGLSELLRRLADREARAGMRREMERGRGWENWYALSGSDWDKVLLGSVSDPEYSRFAGHSVGEVARTVERDPWEVFFSLARLGAFAMPLTMSEENKERVILEDFITFSTDAGPVGGGAATSHPRSFGSFPRVLARYVREQGILSLEEAVHRMTALAANEILAYDRGRLAPGLPADIVVFDAARVRDLATYQRPAVPSRGIVYVLVNGVLVLADGESTGALPGKVLRGPGSKRTPGP